MELSRILLYFLTVLSLTACYPTRPLNERSTELALQAWIYFEQEQQDSINNGNVDPDNGNQNTTGKRKITPKSVFLVPTFTPDTLPPCADGYKADPMGRCIKIANIDNNAHLDYLFKVLMQKFQPNPNHTQSSNKPVSVSIPLPEEKPAAPEIMFVIRTSNETNDGASSALDGIFAVRESGGLVDDVSKENEETTTVDYNTDTTTTLQEQTTTQPEDTTKTDDLQTTTDSSETTTFESQALFFFNSEEEDNETEDIPSTTSEATSTSKVKGLPEASHLDPLFSSDTDVKQSSNFVRFPTDDYISSSYASSFKHEYNPSFLKDDVEDDDDNDDHLHGSEEHAPSWSSSQLEFKFPTHFRHSGRDYRSDSYFPGGSDDVAHLFRHRPRERFR